MSLNGLDSWIQGDNYCTYCGQHLPCYCQEEDEEEIYDCDQCDHPATAHCPTTGKCMIPACGCEQSLEYWKRS